MEKPGRLIALPFADLLPDRPGSKVLQDLLPFEEASFYGERTLLSPGSLAPHTNLYILLTVPDGTMLLPSAQ
jgi:hypothetical protein